MVAPVQLILFVLAFVLFGLSAWLNTNIPEKLIAGGLAALTLGMLLR